MKTNTNYTKGEWIAKVCFIFSIGHPPRLIAETHVDNVGLKEAEANAHLIAAAPSMYEALKEIANYGKKYPSNTPFLANVNDALTKADGKA